MKASRALALFCLSLSHAVAFNPVGRGARLPLSLHLERTGARSLQHSLPRAVDGGSTATSISASRWFPDSTGRHGSAPAALGSSGSISMSVGHQQGAGATGDDVEIQIDEAIEEFLNLDDLLLGADDARRRILEPSKQDESALSQEIGTHVGDVIDEVVNREELNHSHSLTTGGASISALDAVVPSFAADHKFSDAATAVFQDIVSGQDTFSGLEDVTHVFRLLNSESFSDVADGSLAGVENFAERELESEADLFSAVEHLAEQPLLAVEASTDATAVEHLAEQPILAAEASTDAAAVEHLAEQPLLAIEASTDVRAVEHLAEQPPFAVEESTEAKDDLLPGAAFVSELFTKHHLAADDDESSDVGSELFTNHRLAANDDESSDVEKSAEQLRGAEDDSMLGVDCSAKQPHMAEDDLSTDDQAIRTGEGDLTELLLMANDEIGTDGDNFEDDVISGQEDLTELPFMAKGEIRTSGEDLDELPLQVKNDIVSGEGNVIELPPTARELRTDEDFDELPLHVKDDLISGREDLTELPLRAEDKLRTDCEDFDEFALQAEDVLLSVEGNLTELPPMAKHGLRTDREDFDELLQDRDDSLSIEGDATELPFMAKDELRTDGADFVELPLPVKDDSLSGGGEATEPPPEAAEGSDTKTEDFIYHEGREYAGHWFDGIATQDENELKRRFKKLSMLLHPDINHGQDTARKMEELSREYEEALARCRDDKQSGELREAILRIGGIVAALLALHDPILSALLAGVGYITALATDEADKKSKRVSQETETLLRLPAPAKSVTEVPRIEGDKEVELAKRSIDAGSIDAGHWLMSMLARGAQQNMRRIASRVEDGTVARGVEENMRRLASSVENAVEWLANDKPAALPLLPEKGVEEVSRQRTPDGEMPDIVFAEERSAALDAFEYQSANAGHQSLQRLAHGTEQSSHGLTDADRVLVMAGAGNEISPRSSISVLPRQGVPERAVAAQEKSRVPTVHPEEAGQSTVRAASVSRRSRIKRKKR